MVPEILIEENEYRELALHSDLLAIGAILVKLAVAPLAVNLIAEYIKRRLGSKKDDSSFEVTIFLSGDNEKTKTLHYKGPVKDFEKTASSAIEASKHKVPLAQKPPKKSKSNRGRRK